MRTSIRMMLTLTFLVALISCSDQMEVQSRFGDGGEISIKDGKGNAKVWGISFEAETVNGTTASARTESKQAGEVGTHEETAEFSMGDIQIRLLKAGEGDVSVWINGKAYGTQKSGTKFKIDESRDVKIEAPTK